MKELRAALPLLGLTSRFFPLRGKLTTFLKGKVDHHGKSRRPRGKLLVCQHLTDCQLSQEWVAGVDFTDCVEQPCDDTSGRR